MSTEKLGELELLVLLALIRLGEDAYANSIQEELAARADRDVSRATVYVTLTRLENKGLVRSWLGESSPERGGKAKRHVACTAAGVKAARDARAVLQRMWKGLSTLTAEER